MEDVRSALERRPLAAERPRVLDAGCGSDSNIPLPPNAHVVGIDVSAEALERNELLDERMVADLEEVELAPESFDLIVCWDVLEHLRRPERALDTLAGALASGGLLVLGLPNVLSVKGLVTKFTPYSFHRFVYRRAATSPRPPHRTFLRLAISPQAIVRWAGQRGLAVEYLGLYEAPIQARLRGSLHLSGWRWSALSGAVRALSLGAVSTDDTDYVAILSRAPVPPQATPSTARAASPADRPPRS